MRSRQTGELELAATVADHDPATWSNAEVRDGLRTLLVVLNRVDALVAGVVAEFDTRRLSEPDGFRTTRSWLTSFGRLSQGAATGVLSRARLQRQLPALAQAARDGAVSAESLRKVSDLVAHVGVEPVAELDAVLATLASQAAPREVEVACRRIREHVDPDGADPDPDAAARRSLSIARVGSLFNISGKLDVEGGATLLTALDALMRPPTSEDTRTAGQRRADAITELARQALAGGTLPTNGGVRPQLGILLTPQALMGLRGLRPCDKTRAHRATDTASAHGSASANPSGPGGDSAPAGDSGPFEGATSAAGTGTTSAARAGNGSAAPKAGADEKQTWRPPPDWLEQAGIPPGFEMPWNSWADELPIEVAQRLACDCETWRIVLDPATGLPLELGRNYRIVPPWLRKALQARDRGCRWPGCQAPITWCDVHHLVAWYLGGHTDIDNCLLLCRYHHGLVHEGRAPGQRWRIALDPTTGAVTVTRPDGQPYELGPSQPARPG